jgi:hypothetical protein
MDNAVPSKTMVPPTAQNFMPNPFGNQIVFPIATGA